MCFPAVPFGKVHSVSFQFAKTLKDPYYLNINIGYLPAQQLRQFM